ncbi:hypothetical protein B0I35DRAFT_430239 [Stachybotrys elegans]|uniref:Uncharacterized protein n=1 Tax=Stachybotrys elegans TaxID=80388 RepID=A0A8K0SU24_9HYPO|nr:hypothetical protein B0I35DRAFT_430239 [Stachybotrys elegans]
MRTRPAALYDMRRDQREQGTDILGWQRSVLSTGLRNYRRTRLASMREAKDLANKQNLSCRFDVTTSRLAAQFVNVGFLPRCKRPASSAAYMSSNKTARSLHTCFSAAGKLNRCRDLDATAHRDAAALSTRLQAARATFFSACRESMYASPKSTRSGGSSPGVPSVASQTQQHACQQRVERGSARRITSISLMNITRAHPAALGIRDSRMVPNKGDERCHGKCFSKP